MPFLNKNVSDVKLIRVDRDGTVCPYADREIDFGEKAIATCSGDLTDNVPAPSRTRKAWQGRALGILRGVR